MSQKSRYQRLINLIKEMESVVVAYSGGTDSTLLLKAVVDARIPAVAVTGVSASTPAWDRENAVKMAGELGISHILVETDELQKEGYRRNDGMRCYYCKETLFGHLRRIAEKEGLKTVVEGSNLDDTRDYRPGLEAARKAGVKSPLIDVGLTKDDVRRISRSLGLPTWNRPSSPCLASRLSYHSPVTEKKLKLVEQAEAFLREVGIEPLRIRTDGVTARIETSTEEMKRLISEPLRAKVVSHLLGLGFKYVTLDMEGFMSGKMNRELL